MITNMKKTLLSIALIFLFVSTAAAYNWPFANSAGPHPVTGTLGEYRPSHPATTHGGVDMTPVSGVVAGASVIAIEGCVHPTVVEPHTDNESVICGRFNYTHIIATDGIARLIINQGDSVGTIRDIDAAHLHLEEDLGGSNPLRQGGLVHYADTGATTVFEPFQFYKNGTNTQITTSNANGNIILSGEVDILAWARDAQSLGSIRTAPHVVGYLVRDTSNNEVAGVANIRFNSQVATTHIYNTALSNQSTYYYWVTNQIEANSFWST